MDNSENKKVETTLGVVNPNEIKPLEEQHIPTEAEMRVITTFNRVMNLLRNGSRRAKTSKYHNIPKYISKKLSHKRSRLAMQKASRKNNRRTKGHTALKRRA